MADFYVHHSLNRSKAVKFNISLRYFVIKDEKGDHKWTLEIGTTHNDKNGLSISPKRIHYIDVSKLDEIIENAVAELCSQIDWTPLEEDVEPPKVVYNSIEDGSIVPIDSYIKLKIKDELLSAGIDLSNMRIVLNNSVMDFDITDEASISGDAYEYELQWSPPMIIKSRYNGV